MCFCSSPQAKRVYYFRDMEVLESKQLKNYTSMRIGGPAAYLVTVRTEEEVVEAADFAKKMGLPIATLGDGTNVIFDDSGYSGVIILNKIEGYTIDTNGSAHIGAGENWDAIVEHVIKAGFCGIESLSLIPGTAGAGPVNNIGAYGQEISDTLVAVRAFDTNNHVFVDIPASECGFSYRTSRFKNEDHGRFIITQVVLQLRAVDESYQAPTYPSLAAELAKFGTKTPSPVQVRAAVIAVRTSKLPDPKKLANTGSFFKNALVTKEVADTLKSDYPDAPIYEYGSQYKVASGWLIEKAGLKNYRGDGFWVYDKQALVIINESGESFEALKKTYQHVQDTVYEKFKIMLEPEPELL